MFGLQLKKLLEKKMLPIIEECNIRQVELEILFFLANNKCDDTAKAIMQKRHISKAHISKSIDNLYVKGFIRLTPDEFDHRMMHISLEEKAHAVVEKVVHVHRECKNVLHRNISQEEVAIMYKVFKKMSSNIEDEIKKE